MRRQVFVATGVLLVLLSLILGVTEVGYALQGSGGAWVAMSVFVCTGVLGVGMVRVGRGVSEQGSVDLPPS